MNLKTLSFTTLALAAALSPADAYFRAGFKHSKEFRQGATGRPVFRNGEAFLYVVDGTVIFTAGCPLNGSPYPFGVDTTIGCNIGANGVRVATSFNGPPVVQDPQFYEVVGLEAAKTVEPGRPELVTLSARPTVDFPINVVAGMEAYSQSVFYDIQSLSGSIQEYRLAGRGVGDFFVPGYSLVRDYPATAQKQMEKEIVPGIYRFTFPAINRPTVPLYLNFPVRATVEGYVDKPIKQGFRFIKVGPIPSSGPNRGFAEYDAKRIANFQWEGLSLNIIDNADRLYVGFRRMQDNTDPDSDLLTNSFDQPVYDFPPLSPDYDPPTGPTIPGMDIYPGTRIRIPSPVQNYYNLPPGFFHAGNRTVLEVTLERDPQVGIGAVSSRIFQLPIAFVTTFSGFVASYFPEGTDPANLERNADPDGDQIPNWLEWLGGTDPTKSNSQANFTPLTEVPQSVRRSGEVIPGYWYMSISRTPNLPSTVQVIVEKSSTLNTWEPISANDPDWKVEDVPSEPHIRVLSKTPNKPNEGQFRVRYVDNTAY